MSKPKTEEELKYDIFKTYSEFYDESSPDRKPIYFQKFWAATHLWYTNYFFKEEECPFCFEIRKALERILKERKKERDDFFPRLITSLFNARNEYYRNGGFLEKPKDIYKPKRFKDIWKILEMKESNLGRKLSNLEEVQTISLWYQIPEDKVWKIMDKMQTIGGEAWSLDTEIKGDEDDNTGNMYEFIKSETLNPLEELAAKSSRQIYCDAVKSIIESNHGIKRKCLSALFTLHCYENKILFDEIIPILDGEILKLCEENEKKYTDKEVYMIYNPIKSAGESASRLKKENPELFL